jgi:hypothetical protein
MEIAEVRRLDDENQLEAIFKRIEGLQDRLKEETKLKAVPFKENKELQKDVETEKNK